MSIDHSRARFSVERIHADDVYTARRLPDPHSILKLGRPTAKPIPYPRWGICDQAHWARQRDPTLAPNHAAADVSLVQRGSLTGVGSIV